MTHVVLKDIYINFKHNNKKLNLSYLYLDENYVFFVFKVHSENATSYQQLLQTADCHHIQRRLGSV